MKNLKNLIPIVLLLMASTMFLNAQLYVSGGLGYGTSATPEPFGLTYDFASQDVTNSYGNAGQGLRANTALGYMFNENFGAELGVYYFTSPEILVQDTVNADKFYRTYTKAWHLRLTPALVFMASNGKVTPYAKVGLCIPVAGIANARREANDPGLVNPAFNIFLDEATGFELNAEFKGQFSLGFESVAGVKYNLSDKLSLFGEAFFTALRIRRATSEVTRAVAVLPDGSELDIRPILAVGGVYQFTDFVDKVNLIEVTDNMANAEGSLFTFPNGTALPVDDYGSTPEKAHQLLASDGAYNAIGLNIGVRFNF